VHGDGVAHDLHGLLAPDGVVRTRELAGQVDRHTVSAWVQAGRLLRPFPGVVALPDAYENWHTRALAAVLATNGVLSHGSALAVWRVASPATSIHVSVPAQRRALRRRGLVVHRPQETPADRLGGLPVTHLPRSLVDAWSWAHSSRGSARDRDTARGAVIATLRDRQVGVPAIAAELATRPALPGRRALLELMDLVARGCQSELEVWGVQAVLRGPGMPAFVQQYAVDLPFGSVHLDAAVPELKIAVEMDGAAFHGSAEARSGTSDGMRRWLPAAGWCCGSATGA